MYTHDYTGAKISGSKDELEEAVLNGAFIKVVLIDRLYFQVQTAYVIDGHVCAQFSFMHREGFDRIYVSVVSYTEDLT